MRFAAGPEHAPTRQAQLLVELEDAGLEGFLQFGLAGIERLLKLELTRIERFLEFDFAGMDDFLEVGLVRLEGGFLRAFFLPVSASVWPDGSVAGGGKLAVSPALGADSASASASSKSQPWPACDSLLGPNMRRRARRNCS